MKRSMISFKPLGLVSRRPNEQPLPIYREVPLLRPIGDAKSSSAITKHSREKHQNQAN